MKDNYTIGVEEEYMICNPNDGSLVDKADIIMKNIHSVGNVMTRAKEAPSTVLHPRG